MSYKVINIIERLYFGFWICYGIIVAIIVFFGLLMFVIGDVL